MPCTTAPDDLDSQLFIHIGVGAGMIRCMTYGGQFDKAEFVAAGPALTEAKDCGELAKCGEAIISSSVLKYAMPCEPSVTKLEKSRVASVDDLDSAEFYVLNALGKPPVMPAVTARQTMLNGLPAPPCVCQVSCAILATRERERGRVHSNRCKHAVRHPRTHTRTRLTPARALVQRCKRWTTVRAMWRRQCGALCRTLSWRVWTRGSRPRRRRSAGG